MKCDTEILSVTFFQLCDIFSSNILWISSRFNAGSDKKECPLPFLVTTIGGFFQCVNKRQLNRFQPNDCHLITFEVIRSPYLFGLLVEDIMHFFHLIFLGHCVNLQSFNFIWVWECHILLERTKRLWTPQQDTNFERVCWQLWCDWTQNELVVMLNNTNKNCPKPNNHLISQS